MIKIMGKYNGRTEEIDSFETVNEATKMLTEYRMAFGLGWYLYISE